MKSNFIPNFTWTADAGADLSSNRYLPVKLNASGEAIVIAADTDQPVGIQYNAPTAANQEASIVSEGIALVKCAGAVTVGTKVEITAAGSIQNVTTGKTVIGIALQTGVANDVVSVLLTL